MHNHVFSIVYSVALYSKLSIEYNYTIILYDHINLKVLKIIR